MHIETRFSPKVYGSILPSGSYVRASVHEEDLPQNYIYFFPLRPNPDAPEMPETANISYRSPFWNSYLSKITSLTFGDKGSSDSTLLEEDYSAET